MAQPNQSIRYCWEADKVKTLIRLRAELSPLFTGKRNASKYAWAVVERELNVPLPISKIIKKWNNLLQEYKAIKLSEEPKRREWPFFTLMDVYFSDQVNDPSLRLFSSTKRFDTDTFDDKNFDEELQAVLAAANLNASMSSVLSNLGLGLGMNRQNYLKRDTNLTSNNSNRNTPMDIDVVDEKHDDEDDDTKSEVSINLSTKLLNNSLMNTPNSTNDKNNNKSHLTSLNTSKLSDSLSKEKDSLIEPNNNTLNANRNLMANSAGYNTASEGSINSSRNSASSHANNNDDDYEDNMVRTYERNLKNLNQKFLHEMNEHHNIDQYLLSWRGFHGNMCKGFHNLQRDGQMVDVTIAAGGKIFKAHKLVLSVCSPYFQKIFIEHPSSHPILFMTDVNSNHMAGLLDFMYSGQVNVKYEDLPNFLKVAEALQVKGLHGESTGDNNEEREREREREENNYAMQYRQQQQQQALHLQQQQQQFNYSQMRQPAPAHFQHPDNIINENRQNIRHHIKPKTSLINSSNNNPDTTTMNMTNNNNTSTTNNNLSLANNHLQQQQKFGVQQVNSSSKMLDNQKYQKYFAKRKLLAQYEQEMRQEKRNRSGDSIDDESDNIRPLNMRRSQSDATDDDSRLDNGKAHNNNNNCVGLNLIQNIKTEKGDDHEHPDVNGNDEETATGFYGSQLSKMKHSILEPNIVLQHSDEVISPSSNGNSNSITSTLQNTNLSQKTAS
ncbi:hypothetical protein PVAND_006949 [Polypedilum vanderplanki]|uniref:BTB domain-containing protein n=1 Tax=Polypedilum vanderplanki TaxID=319348 RepID=A0A9J6C5Q5_POLVA|nr:hypothetical protein PVAND_006949 [Polypedilum vanderplanki]